MATRTGRSGTYNISTENQYISGYVQWTETYDDSTYTATNKTTVTQVAYLHRTNIYSGTTSITNISGQRTAYFGSDTVTDTSNMTLSIAGNSSSSGGSYTEVYRASKEIQHDSDGGKSLSLGFYMTNSASGAGGNAFRVSKTTSNVTLTTIPRASSVSCSSPYIGDAATITIDKKASSFTSTVTYNIGGITGTVATKTSSTVLSLNTSSIKSQIYALIPNGKSTTGTVYCTTYSGNTQVGSTASATFSLYAKESDCKPTVSGVVVDTNSDTIALTGNSSIIVKNASKPKVTITATPKYSASISSYSINLNDGQTSNQREHTFNTINSNSIAIDAYDTRQYHNSQTINLSNRVVNYLKLQFNNISLKRPEGTSNQVILNANGVWYNGDFSQSNSNTLSCSIKYKETSSNTWIDCGTITPTISNNTFTFTNLNLSTLNIYNLTTDVKYQADKEYYIYSSNVYRLLEEGVDYEVDDDIVGDIYEKNNPVFDYDKEYQFKIIATDLLMTVGSENKDIQTVPKGIAVVEIGNEFVNINGSFFLNDIPIINEYSTTEKVVGKWIDGKPLYQKTFYNNLTLGSITAIASLSSLNYDYVSFYDVSFTKTNVSSGSGMFWFPVFYDTSSDYARVYLRDRDKKLMGLVVGEAVTELKVYVTLRYTKTTD